MNDYERGFEAGKRDGYKSHQRRAADIVISKIPEDLFTHKDAWRSLIASNLTGEGDMEDLAYYEHELKVFDKVFSELERLKESVNEAI